MDYNTLVAAKSTQGSIKSWVRYNEINSDLVLSLSQSYIYQRLRVREMRGRATNQAIDAGDDSVTFPADFLDPITFMIRYPTMKLQLRNEREIHERYRIYDDTNALIQGIPTNYCLLGQDAVFDCAADQDYAYDLVYFKSLPLLSASNQTNFLTSRYQHILHYAAVGQAALQWKDNAEAEVALKMADGFMDDAKEMDDLSRRGQEP